MRLCAGGLKIIIIIIIIIITTTTYLWCCHHDQSHCESSPGSSDECRLSAGWPPTLRPSQLTWAVSPPKIVSHRPHPSSPLGPCISQHSHAAAAESRPSSSRSISPARRAHSSKPAAERLLMWALAGTDRQTDTVLFHRPCSAYYADSGAAPILTTVSKVK